MTPSSSVETMLNIRNEISAMKESILRSQKLRHDPTTAMQSPQGHPASPAPTTQVLLGSAVLSSYFSPPPESFKSPSGDTNGTNGSVDASRYVVLVEVGCAFQIRL